MSEFASFPGAEYWVDDSGNVWQSKPEPEPKFERIIELNSIIQVDCGKDFAIFLSSGGTMYGVGSNHAGQLSGAESTYYESITKIYGFTNIKKISAGYLGHTVAIDIGGVVWGCGKNTGKELGEGLPRILSPVVVKKIPKAQNICTGATFTLVLDLDGNVWYIGHCESVQMSLSINRFVPIGKTGVCVRFDPTPVKLPLEEPIVNISAYKETVLLTDGIKTWSCVPTNHFALTLLKNTFENAVRQIKTGKTCAVVLDGAGEIWSHNSTNGAFHLCENLPDCREAIYVNDQRIAIRRSNNNVVHCPVGSLDTFDYSLPFNLPLLQTFAPAIKSARTKKSK